MMNDYLVQEANGSRVLRVTKITPHGNTGTHFNVSGHRWIEASQRFTKSVSSWPMAGWVPVILAYTSQYGPAVFVPDNRPATRDAILAEFAQ